MGSMNQVCTVCESEAPPADTLFEGRWVHSWHLSEFVRDGTAAPIQDSRFKIQEASRAGELDEGETVARTGRRQSVNRKEVKRLYGEGLSDCQIAEQLGCSPSAVLYSRRGLGLAAIGKAGKRKGTRKMGPTLPVGCEVPAEEKQLARGASANGGLYVDEAALTWLLERVWASLSLEEKGKCIALMAS